MTLTKTRNQLAALFFSVTALGAAAEFDAKVRGDFFAGFAGNDAALERAMKASGDAIAESPATSAEALAWHGSGLLVIAGRKFRQGDMAAGGELWQKAVAEMDKAGTMEPDNPSILVPRASAWFAASRQAPPPMAKPIREKAIADFEHIYDMQKGYFDKLDIHNRSELLFGLADGYARNNEPVKAKEYFEKLAALGTRSGHLEQAKLYLGGEKYEVSGVGCVGCHTGSKQEAAKQEGAK